MSNYQIAFTGEFTAPIRAQIRRKRLELGLSYKQLSLILHTDWSTLRNWENGRISHCHPVNIRRINDFLEGKNDESISYSLQQPEMGRQAYLELPLSLQLCADRITDVCKLCADQESLREQFLSSVNSSIADAIRQLMA